MSRCARRAGRSATSTCGPSPTRVTTRASSPTASPPSWTRAAGARPSASSSSAPAAARRAQRDIDLRPALYTHYYTREFPDRFHAQMDTRRWGPGERIVFEPYSREAFERSFDWIARHEIFEDGRMGSGRYDEAVVSIAAQ